MSPTAEEVLKARLEEQAREEARRREEWARKAEAQRAEAQRKDSARRLVLLTKLEAKAQLAVKRLEDKGFPGGELKEVVTRYVPKRTWWGRRYYDQIVEERACWLVDASGDMYYPNQRDCYLTSDARVVVFARISNYPNRYNRNQNGMHDLATVDILANYKLEAVIEGLKQLGI